MNIYGQDCVCQFVIAQFPNNPNWAEDFDPTWDMDISCQGQMWYTRPQLFFNCTVCLTGRAANKHSYVELSLVFFRYFSAPLSQSISRHCVMQHNWVPMLCYSASSRNEPGLYICPVNNVLGSVPLIPYFLAGNKHLTLAHGKGSGQGAIADTCPDAGNSRLFEVSPWMWRYGRGQPRKLSVTEAEGDRNGGARLISKRWKPWSCAGGSVGKSFTSVSMAARLLRQMGSKFGVK